MLRTSQFLTILISKSVWRAGVVQLLPASTSKSAPSPSVFNSRFPNRSRAQAWCIFWQVQLPKMLPHPHFLTVLTSKSLSPADVVQILPHFEQPVLRTRPFLGADFPGQRSHKTMEKTAFRAFPTRQILMSHISAVSHLRDLISWLTHLPQQLSVYSEVRFLNFR